MSAYNLCSIFTNITHFLLYSFQDQLQPVSIGFLWFRSMVLAFWSFLGPDRFTVLPKKAIGLRLDQTLKHYLKHHFQCSYWRLPMCQKTSDCTWLSWLATSEWLHLTGDFQWWELWSRKYQRVIDNCWWIVKLAPPFDRVDSVNSLQTDHVDCLKCGSRFSWRVDWTLGPVQVQTKTKHVRR